MSVLKRYPAFKNMHQGFLKHAIFQSTKMSDLQDSFVRCSEESKAITARMIEERFDRQAFERKSMILALAPYLFITAWFYLCTYPIEKWWRRKKENL